MRMPPSLKSFCSTRPVLKAMALGGVDTGRNMAVEADKAMIRVISTFKAIRMAMPSGIITVLVAVLLIILEKSMVA